MADELQFYGLTTQTGLTVTAQVYDTAGAQVGADVACAEVGSSSIYIGDMPTASAGSYGVRFFASSEVIGFGEIEWDGSAEVTERITKAAVDTKPTLADMEASSPLTTVADVSGLATSASIAALNDFDPDNDTVARVTLVDTTTTNTDMRGTDGAVTSAGDATAAQQTAILSAISALNDLSAADVTGAVPTVAQIEAALLDDGDGQALLAAIATAIGNQNVDEIALVAAIRADLERAGGSLDNLPTLAEMEASAALTAAGATPQAIAAEIVSGSQGKVPADIQCVTGQPISGAGTKADPWGP